MKKTIKLEAALQIAALTTVLAALGLHAAGITNDIALDFSTNSNPNGVWTYGYTTNLGTVLVPYVEYGNSSGVLYWRRNLSYGAPAVNWNSTTNTVKTGTPSLLPHQAGFHPGQNGQHSVYRFTAPASGAYRLESSFFGSDTTGTSTDVHVLLNNAQIFFGLVNGFGTNTGPTFNTNLVLQAGDRVDFTVHYGTNVGSTFWNDTTGISARLIRTVLSLSVAATATNTVVVSWPIPADNWRLHATTNLVAGGTEWTEIAPPYGTNGANLQFIEPAPAGNRFYRLHLP